MLYHKTRFHAELSSFFDGEGLCLQSFDGARSSQVNCDIGTTFDFKSECFDHAATLVFGVNADWWGGQDAERGFPAVERFIVLVCTICVSNTSTLRRIIVRCMSENGERWKKTECHAERKQAAIDFSEQTKPAGCCWQAQKIHHTALKSGRCGSQYTTGQNILGSITANVTYPASRIPPPSSSRRP